jgi:hypothetical protein
MENWRDNAQARMPASANRSSTSNSAAAKAD